MSANIRKMALLIKIRSAESANVQLFCTSCAVLSAHDAWPGACMYGSGFRHYAWPQKPSPAGAGSVAWATPCFLLRTVRGPGHACTAPALGTTLGHESEARLAQDRWRGRRRAPKACRSFQAASRNELKTAAAVSIGPQIRYFRYGLVFAGSIGHTFR